MRFGMDYDDEEEFIRLIRKKHGFVAIWTDGSVSWHRRTVPGTSFLDEAPIVLSCRPDKPALAAVAAYTTALRGHWQQRAAR